MATKPSKQEKPIQPKLFTHSEILDHLDSRVRVAHIGAEQYVSALDILQYHGNKKNPTQSWRVTLDFMARQGSSTPSVEHQFEGRGQKPTPVIDIETFLRFVQSAEVPEWEPIREWLAHIGAEQLKSKAERKRDNELEKYKKAGYGERPEILRLEAYNDALKEYNALRSTYARIVDNPDYAMLADSEYMALFGMFSKQLKAVLGNDNIRKALDTEQLDTMAFANRRLRGVLATQGDKLSNEAVKHIIDVVVSPLGVYLRGLSELQGKKLLK